MEYSLLQQHLEDSEAVNTPTIFTREEKDDRILRSSEINETHLFKKIPAFYGIRKFFLTHSQEPANWPILSQINLLFVSPFHFFKINFNIIITSTPIFSKWPLYSSFPNQNLTCTSPFPQTCHMSNLSHSSSTVRQNNTCQVIKTSSLLSNFLLFPVTSTHAQCERQSFTPTRNNRQIWSYAASRRKFTFNPLALALDI